ncbi:MAG TPA: hypothetical protein VEM41_10390 [Actinomycetota bacterium]|nr:hypothetical protein [Actinomycetota bacterium]
MFLIVLLVVALMGGSLYYLHLRSSKKPAPTTVALSLSFAKGDIHTYRTTISYRGTIGVAHDKIPFDMTIRGDMQWRVDKVSSQGIASVSVTLLHGQMTQSGVTSPMGKDGMQLRIAPDGRILSSCTFGGPGPSWIGSLGIPGSTELAPVLPPDGSTSTGVSWSSQFGQTFPGGKNAIAFETTNTYLRSQQIHGVGAAVVNTRATIPLRLTIDLRRLFAEYKWPTKVLGHYRPQMHYKGSIDTSITSWIDQAKRLILHESATSKFDVVLTVSNVPPRSRIPGGSLRFLGTATVTSNLLSSSHSSGASGSSSSSW